MAKRKEASVEGSGDRHGTAASVSADMWEVDRGPASGRLRLGEPKLMRGSLV